MINISAETYVSDVADLAKQIDASKYKNIYGIPRGGVLVALELSKHLGLPVADAPGPDTLIVDDLIDSGRTLEAYPNHDTAVIYRKVNSPKLETYCAREVDGWIVFFYDKQNFDEQDNVVRILQYLGEDAAREGLRNTPEKYLDLLKKFLTPPALDIKSTETTDVTPVKYTEIPFVSLCECHIMPILGTATIEFTPNGKTISRAEATKMVNLLAHKIQTQQTLESRIVESAQNILNPSALFVSVSERNLCDELGVQ